MGDEILTKKCKPVKAMNDRTMELIEDMFETMYQANGGGLAAPQVGVLKQIVTIDVDDGNPVSYTHLDVYKRQHHGDADSVPGHFPVCHVPVRQGYRGVKEACHAGRLCHVHYVHAVHCHDGGCSGPDRRCLLSR